MHFSFQPVTAWPAIWLSPPQLHLFSPSSLQWDPHRGDKGPLQQPRKKSTEAQV